MKKFLLILLTITSFSVSASDTCLLKLNNNIVSSVSQSEVIQILNKKGYIINSEENDVILTLDKTTFTNNSYISATLSLVSDENISTSSTVKYNDLFNFHRDNKAEILQAQSFKTPKEKTEALIKSNELSQSSTQFHDRKTSHSILKALKKLPNCIDFTN